MCIRDRPWELRCPHTVQNSQQSLIFSSRAYALVYCGARLRRSRAWVSRAVTLQRKIRDCSQPSSFPIKVLDNQIYCSPLWDVHLVTFSFSLIGKDKDKLCVVLFSSAFSRGHITTTPRKRLWKVWLGCQKRICLFFLANRETVLRMNFKRLMKSLPSSRIHAKFACQFCHHYFTQIF